MARNAKSLRTARKYARLCREEVDLTKAPESKDVVEGVDFVTRALEVYGKRRVWAAMRRDLDTEERRAWQTVVERRERGIPLRRVPRALLFNPGGAATIGYRLALAPRVA